MDVRSKNAERLFERFGRSYAGGDVVFNEDDPASEVFMILEGRVRLLKRVRAVERDIVILKTGDIFGEAALVRAGDGQIPLKHQLGARDLDVVRAGGALAHTRAKGTDLFAANRSVPFGVTS